MGVFTGLGKGAVGLFLRPATGLLDLTSASYSHSGAKSKFFCGNIVAVNFLPVIVEVFFCEFFLIACV